MLTVSGFAQLTFANSSFTFSATTIGQTSYGGEQINILGSNPVTMVIPFTLTGADPSDFSWTLGTSSITEQGGDSSIIDVSFKPSLAGPESAILTINTTDGNHASLNLSGVGLDVPEPSMWALMLGGLGVLIYGCTRMPKGSLATRS